MIKKILCILTFLIIYFHNIHSISLITIPSNASLTIPFNAIVEPDSFYIEENGELIVYNSSCIGDAGLGGSGNYVILNIPNIINGNAFLENQTDYEDIKVVFYMKVPGILKDSTYTDVNGYYSIQLESGIYDIIYSKDNFHSVYKIDEALYSETTLPDVTLLDTPATLHVPSMYPTIQTAINESFTGDTILVAPGTYFENIDFLGKGITVASEFLTTQDTTFIQNTILDGGDSHRLVNFVSGEDSTAVLNGFTITNGDAGTYPSYGGGILIENSSPTLCNLIITQCDSDGGGAIKCNYSNVIINNLVVDNNTAGADGGGGILISNSNLNILNTIISQNYGHTSGGGGVRILNSSVYLENIVIKENSTSIDGGGIKCISNSDISMSNCIIKNNDSREGGGLYITGSDAIIQNVIIDSNSATTAQAVDTYGGGIYYEGSSDNIQIRNVIISRNNADYGGGFYTRGDASPQVINSTIVGNTAIYDGGGIYCYINSSPQLVNTIVSDNIGNYGIYVQSGNPLVSYSDFYNNENGNFYNCDQWTGVNITTNANGDSCDAYFNIQLDPCFADTVNGDYHLTEVSPCIDAGDPTFPLDPDGSVIEMGRYYYPQFKANFSSDVTSGHYPLTVHFIDESLGNPTSWAWDFQNDGSIDSYDQNPSWIYNDNGVYDVKLEISDGTNTASEIKTGFINVTQLGVTIVFGENGLYKAYDYSTDTWMEIASTGGGWSINGMAAAYDAQSNKLIASCFGDNHKAYDYVSNSWEDISHPGSWGNDILVAAYDIESDVVVMISNNGTVRAYDYETDTWIDKTTFIFNQTPTGMAAAYDISNDLIIVLCNDLVNWSYDYNTDTWTELSSSGGNWSSSGMAAAYDIESDRIIISCNGDYHKAYDADTDTWEDITHPGQWETNQLVASYDVQNDRVIVIDDHGHTKAYDYNSNTWEELSNQGNGWSINGMAGAYTGYGLVVDFNTTPSYGFAPLTVNFADESIGSPITWEWDFENDGVIDSYDQNPTWTYNDPGNYAVSFTVSDGYITNTKIQENCVIVYNEGTGTPPAALWSKTFAGNSTDYIYCVQECNDGGFVFSGATSSDPWSTGGANIWLIKTDANGDTLWVNTYGGNHGENGQAVQQTSDNGFIVCGYKYLTKTDSLGNFQWQQELYYPNPSNPEEFWDVKQTADSGYILTGSNGNGFLFLKTDSFGNEEWRQNAYGNRGFSVTETSDGGFVAVGIYSIPNQGTHISLNKVDSNGNIEWERTLGQGYQVSWGNCVEETSDNGLIIAGYSVVEATSNWDVYLIKTYANGYEEWSRSIGGDGNQQGYSVKQTQDEGYIISGSPNAFVLRTDNLGYEIWRNSYNNNFDKAKCIDLYEDGGFIISGSFVGNGSDGYAIRIDSELNADFYADQTWGYEPLNVQFYDSSFTSFSNPSITYEWDFDNDGAVDSYDQNPTWTYNDPGHYSVSLTLFDGVNSSVELKENYITVFYQGPVTAPEIAWENTFGGPNDDIGRCVQQTSDGGFIITGETQSFGNGDSDFWLLKTDSEGNEEWNQTFGGSNVDIPYKVQQTLDNGYIIAGYTTSYGVGNGDWWLIKTDSLGNEVWNQTYGGTSDEIAYSVIETIDGGYALAGYTWSFGVGGRDVWLLKVDNLGNLEWNSLFGGGADENAYSVKQTYDGGFIIAGYKTAYNNPNDRDAWLIKTDSLGNEEWNRSFGGTSYDVAQSIEQTTDGGFVFAGTTYSFAFDELDMWLVKTNNVGDLEWYKTFGDFNNDEGYTIDLTPDNGYVVAGYKDYDLLYIVKTDQLGNLLWEKNHKCCFKSLFYSANNRYWVHSYWFKRRCWW